MANYDFGFGGMVKFMVVGIAAVFGVAASGVFLFGYWIARLGGCPRPCWTGVAALVLVAAGFAVLTFEDAIRGWFRARLGKGEPC